MEFREKVTFGGVQRGVQREKYSEGECREGTLKFRGECGERESIREESRERESREREPSTF